MDKATAAEWYSKAADLGDADSMCVLASMYRNGDGVPMDKAKAAELYRKAADLGESDAQYDLAFMLDSGEGIPADREEAERYFRMSAAQGDSDACLCMGGICFERGEYGEAEDYFLTAALKGDVKAEYNIGLLYSGGYLGNADKAKAAEWFGSAAEKGFVLAHTMLGSIAMDSGDVKEAERRFREAAEKGESVAMYNLGALGLSGGAAIGFEEAVGWVSRAASAGYEPAYELLARLNSQGRR
jgi:TPR repeat protein